MTNPTSPDHLLRHLHQPLIRRAMAAMLRNSAGEVQQPSNDSNAMIVGDKLYVVLRNVNGILAVYRVRTDGVLKKLVRWPAELEKQA